MQVLEQISSVFYTSDELFSDSIFEYMKKKVLDIGAIRLDLAKPDGTAIAITSEGKLFSDFNLNIFNDVATVFDKKKTKKFFLHLYKII